jgi:hypothetical protein
MVYAANAPVFHSAKQKGRTTVAAQLIQNPDLALGVAEGNQILSQKLHMPWITLRFRQLTRQQCRQPITSHGITHRSSKSDPAHPLIVCTR